MCPIVLITNIIITLNANNYFTKTFMTGIWQDRKYAFRILKSFDRLRSNFHKLANLRLTSFTFWNPGFMTLNLKIIFQNCWHNNLSSPLFCQLTVNMYHQLTDPSQPPLFCVMREGLVNEKAWMLEQRETSKLKLFLTDNSCTHFGASKCLLFIVCRFLSSIHIVVPHKV